MKIKSQSEKGFTLLEMMVTISIIGILTAMGIPAFITYQKQNASRVSAQDIKNTLLEAQTLSRATDVSVKGYDYYYVTINISEGKIDSGRGKFVTDSSTPDPSSQKSLRDTTSIDSQAKIELAQPTSSDPNIISYYYLIPSGKMLFNGLEPGYDNPRSIIWVRSKEASGSEKQPGDQTIVIDGQGGNIKIVEELVTLSPPPTPSP